MKKFNVTGACYQDKHYMVDISERLCQIQKMVEDGCYFTINRGRQYGKTTTLSLLKSKLENEYTVFSISFEGLGEEQFQSSMQFVQTFLGLLQDTIDYGETKADEEVRNYLNEITKQQAGDFRELGNMISKLCHMSDKPMVLLIDEVDQAGNYKSFVDFLGLLRAKFMTRNTRPTFQSVILAGVYDITNLRLKIRDEKEHQYNSPWNIATAFTLPMDFDVDGIATMLHDYEEEHHMGMDVVSVAQMIYDYTSGYPYMVSRICQLIDEVILGKEANYNIVRAWSIEGVKEAVKLLLAESNTLFDDMRKKLHDFPELRNMLYEMLYNGKSYPYNQYQYAVDIAEMFGYVGNENGKVRISNRVFEIWIYNLLAYYSDVAHRLNFDFNKNKEIGVKELKFDNKVIVEAVV